MGCTGNWPEGNRGVTHYLVIWDVEVVVMGVHDWGIANKI